MPTITSLVGTPINADGVATDPEIIRGWLSELEARIEGMSREFMLNVHKITCSDRIDVRKVNMLIPLEINRAEIPIPVERYSKRSTYIGLIARRHLASSVS
jgi:hypothetical protein